MINKKRQQSKKCYVFYVGAECHGQRLDMALAGCTKDWMSRGHWQKYIEQNKVQPLEAKDRNVFKSVERGAPSFFLPVEAVCTDPLWQLDISPCTTIKGKERISSGQWFVVHDLVKDPATSDSEEKPPLSAPLVHVPVIYEDEDILVINKPAGLVVHPGPGHAGDTLVDILQKGFDLRCFSALNCKRPGIVHRLDKETSGLLVVAKHESAHYYLSRQFMQRTVEKRYWAFVWGRPSPEFGHLTAPLARKKGDLMRRCIAAPHDKMAKEAHTQYYTHASCHSPWGWITWLQCRLHTGRTHQIRVHCSAMGHPLVGDMLYARTGLGSALKFALSNEDPAAPQPFSEFVPAFTHKISTTQECAIFPKKFNGVLDGIKPIGRLPEGRHGLHAYALGFVHPDGSEKYFEIPLPQDLADFWRHISGETRSSAP